MQDKFIASKNALWVESYRVVEVGCSEWGGGGLFVTLMALHGFSLNYHFVYGPL